MELNSEEKIISEAIFAARKVQDFLWGENALNTATDFITTWTEVFQKRVDKIKEVDTKNSNAKVELRKRALQQAALSIYFIKLLDQEELEYKEEFDEQSLSYHNHIERVTATGRLDTTQLTKLLAKNLEDDKLNQFFKKIENGGVIKSSNNCSALEISEARMCGNFYVNEDSLGFVYFPDRSYEYDAPYMTYNEIRIWHESRKGYSLKGKDLKFDGLIKKHIEKSLYSKLSEIVLEHLEKGYDAEEITIWLTKTDRELLEKEVDQKFKSVLAGHDTERNKKLVCCSFDSSPLIGIQDIEELEFKAVNLQVSIANYSLVTIKECHSRISAIRYYEKVVEVI